ncbi:putative quinol monooxygenase [Henriciella aquimarina]|uniref:putative quinol monooxygenase n=1 Tax=Henriciella aquimarina TaxID=545261 RepID=UPI000A056EAE|nr:putative quinol monooxygenase [Henriciella aquimarina]
MIVIEGTVRIDPARLDDARPAMETMVRASRAEAGCIDYAYAIDMLDPGLVRVSERWQDRDALKAHFESVHMTEWRGVIAGLGLRDRSLRLYEAEPEEI